MRGSVSNDTSCGDTTQTFYDCFNWLIFLITAY